MPETPRPPVTPAPVRLQLHRGIGWGVYGSATTLVALIGTWATVSYLGSGRWWMAGVCGLVGVPLTAFLATLTDAMVRPGLTVTTDGIAGRLPRGRPIELGWPDVSIDVAEDTPPATLRLELGEASLSINAFSWQGFTDFVELVHDTPAASARLTPAGLREVRRFLRLDR